MNDVSVVEPVHQRPEPRDQVGRVVRLDLAERTAGTPHRDQRAALHGEPSHRHLGDRHAGGGCQQGDEGLVLYLSLPASRERRVVAVPDLSPHGVEELRVACVAAVDLDAHRLTRFAEAVHRHHSRGLAWCHGELGDLQPKCPQR